MTKDWYTAKELAGLPGFPSTERRSREKCIKEKITARKKLKGKGYEYHISALPLVTQQYLAKQQAEALAAQSPEFLAGKAIAEKAKQDKALSVEQKQRIMEQGAAQLMQLTGKARLRAEVKLCILGAYDEFVAPYIKVNKKSAGERVFAQYYNHRALALDEQVYQVVPSIAWNYPRRWKKIIETEGAAALGGRYQACKKKSKIDSNPDMQQMAQGLVYNEPEIAGAHLREILIAHSELNNLKWDVPSVSKVREWLKNFKAEHPLLMAKLNNPDDFKNRFMPAFGKANANITHINQLWELDSTPTDVLLVDGRYSIVGAIDVYSRRPIVVLYPTSSAEAVCLLLRKAILTFGVPEAVKTDNGKDYKSKRVVSVLQSLGIRQEIAPPFSGDAKPHIERFFKTWSHGISKLLPGYGGHDVASREKLQSRASFADQIMKKGAKDIEISMTAKELQLVIDDWIDNYYNNKKHRITKQKPLERWNAQRTTIRTVSNERALDILLSPVPAQGGKQAGVRKVNKDIGIAVNGFSYVSAELGTLVGSNVFCSWNPNNIGEVYVFNSTQLEFICIAKCPELVDQNISLSELSLAAKQQQNAKIAEEKAQLRKAKNSVNLGEAARNVIAAAKKRNSSMAYMPQPSTPAQSGLLTQAIHATNQVDVKPTMSAENFHKLRQEQLEMEKTKAAMENAKPRFTSPFDEYCWILTQSKQRPLTPEEIVKRENYKKASPTSAKMAEKMLDIKQEETKASK